MLRRSLLLALLAAMTLTLNLPDPVKADPTRCSDYISGGSSNPAFGTLIAERLVTKTVTYSAGGSLSKFGGSYTTTTEVQYYEGLYQMAGGQRTRLDCSTYTLI
ncbi:MAG: hypothetical protein R3E98_17205 [Gemmatimonadota bacterium]|nr:hypothetical protein [Gemmatimonadota bacterium]